MRHSISLLSVKAKVGSIIFFLCYLLALFAVLIAFYFPFLSRKQSFYLFNVTFYFEPLSRFIGEAFRQGRMPMWNPLSYCGMPQIAVPSPGIFYPFNLLFGRMDFSQALATIILAHQLIAAAGGFLLVASAGWGLFPASVAGLILALSGYMFGLESNYTLMASAAWLPILFWALRKVGSGFKVSNVLYFVLASLFTFFLLAAGRPEISLPGVAFIVAYIIYDLWRSKNRGDREWFKTFLWRSAALFLGLLLACPEILPAWEWAQISRRAAGLNPKEVFLWSANWYDYLCLVLSQPLGDLELSGAKFLQLVQTRSGTIPFLSSAYVGPVAVTLALWGACDRSFKQRFLVLAALLVAIVVSLGNQTPVDPMFVHSTSLFALFRYPVKLIFFPVACISLLAARGACVGLDGKVGRAGKVVSWTFWLVGIAGSLVLILVPEVVAGVLRAWLVVGRAVTPGYFAESQVLIGQAGLKACALGLACLAIAHLYWLGKLRKNLFASVLVVMLAATMLLSAFTFARHATKPDFYEQPSYLAEKIKKLYLISGGNERQNPRIAVLYADPFLNPPWYHQKDASPSENFSQYARQLLFPNTHMDAGIPSIFCFEASETSDWNQLFWKTVLASRLVPPDSDYRNGVKTDVPLGRVCQMSGTKYATTQMVKFIPGARPEPVSKLDPQFFELIDENPFMNVRIYQVKDTLDRAYFAGAWQWAKSHQDVMDKITWADFSGFDPTRGVLVEQATRSSGQDTLTPPNSSWLPPAEPRQGKVFSGQSGSQYVLITEAYPERVALSVKIDEPGFVVLADQFYPGWQARLDSAPVRIYRANGVQRAVFVPSGSHLVEFQYDPDSLKLGLNLAYLALAILSCLVVFVYFRLMIRFGR